MTLIGVIHTDHLQWLKNKTIDGIIHEKTSKLLNSNIFVNKQLNEEIRSKIENALINNSSNKYFLGKILIFQSTKMALFIIKMIKGKLYYLSQIY